MSGGGKVIATGRRYAIGWYEDWYVIWKVSEPEKPVAYEELRNPGGWKILAERFLQLESIDLTRYNPSDGMDTTNAGQPVANARNTAWVTFPASGGASPKFTKYHDPNSKHQEPNSIQNIRRSLGVVGILFGFLPLITVSCGGLSESFSTYALASGNPANNISSYPGLWLIPIGFIGLLAFKGVRKAIIAAVILGVGVLYGVSFLHKNTGNSTLNIVTVSYGAWLMALTIIASYIYLWKEWLEHKRTNLYINDQNDSENGLGHKE